MVHDKMVNGFMKTNYIQPQTAKQAIRHSSVLCVSTHSNVGLSGGDQEGDVTSAF